MTESRERWLQSVQRAEKHLRDTPPEYLGPAARRLLGYESTRCSMCGHDTEDDVEDLADIKALMDQLETVERALVSWTNNEKVIMAKCLDESCLYTTQNPETSHSHSKGGIWTKLDTPSGG